MRKAKIKMKNIWVATAKGNSNPLTGSKAGEWSLEAKEILLRC